MSRLIHYSSTPLTSVHSEQQVIRPSFIAKPRGLWVSVEGDDDWLSWCRSEGYQLANLEHATEVVLKPDARLLWVSGENAIREFGGKYEANGRDERTGLDFDSYIQWDKVAQEYQGIIIAPYCWQVRLELMWYYGWDCACGCIWDADAVEKIAAIENERNDGLHSAAL